MSLFGLRFDFRNPDFAGTTMAERYAAALDMAEWADRLGFVIIVPLRAPRLRRRLPARARCRWPRPSRRARPTSRIRIAALIAPFHDPLRLAEDVAVVDLLSNGRLDLVVANGYVPGEFAMFDVPTLRAGRRTTETVATLKQAWTGEPFEFRGRTVQVTPDPGAAGRPAGRPRRQRPEGGPPAPPASPTASCRRTAPSGTCYREEMLALGQARSRPVRRRRHQRLPPRATTSSRAGSSTRRYALHEMNAYGQWMASAGIGREGGYVTTDDTEALRATGQYRVLTPDDLVAEIREKGEYGFTLFHPLVGGVPPAMGWESLHLFEHEVLPRLTAKLIVTPPGLRARGTRTASRSPRSCRARAAPGRPARAPRRAHG